MIYIRFLALAGTADMFTQLIGAWAVDPLLLVIAASLIYLVLGMFLDPLRHDLADHSGAGAHVLQALDLDLVWFGVLVVKYIGIGLLTPPVGFNVYVVKNVVGDRIPLETIFRGCFWFLGAR